MRIKFLTFLVFMIGMLLSQTARASVGGSVSGTAFPCGSTGTLYNNQTSGTMKLELSLTNFGSCSTSFSWIDAAGNPQSINIAANDSTVFSTSLQANRIVSWASSAGSGFADFIWDLEQSPAQSVGTPGQLQTTPCGSTGTLYKNLTGASTTVNFAVTNGPACGFTVSWTDSSGLAQTINLALSGSQGVSITLPADGTITWTAGSGSGPISAEWRLERRVLASMNP